LLDAIIGPDQPRTVDREEGTVDDDVRYWGGLLAGGINLLIWNAVVLGLAIATGVKGPVPVLRKLSVWTAVCFVNLSAAYITLAAWYPTWYRPVADLVIKLVVVPAIVLAFYLTLTSCIASFQKTAEERRLAMRVGAVSALPLFVFWASQVFLDGWAKVLAEIVAGLLFVGALFLAQKSQARLRARFRNGNTA
jgi:hypothetical protein